MTDIYVIADCSGSFSELGKQDLQRLLLHTVSDICEAEEFAAFAFHLYTWSGAVEEYQDGKRLTAAGRGNADALLAFVRALPERSRIMLMSDGVFEEDIGAVRREVMRKKDVFLTVAVGADADMEALQRFATVQRLFRPAEIVTAIKVLCFTGD